MATDYAPEMLKSGSTYLWALQIHVIVSNLEIYTNDVDERHIIAIGIFISYGSAQYGIRE
jgi:hypothetical protein